MNPPTETLAERLTAHNAWRRGETDEQPINATLLGKTLDHAALRLLAQHETMMRQTECIAELEKELAEMAENYRDASSSAHSWKLKAERYWQELETAREANAGLMKACDKLDRDLAQERQDRKQADIDTIRALGERNDARKELDEWKDKLDASELTHAASRADLDDCKLALQAERALADRLAGAIETHKAQFPDEALDGDIKLWSHLDEWKDSQEKESRRE